MGRDGMGAVNAYGNELNVLALRSVRWSSVRPCVWPEKGSGNMHNVTRNEGIWSYEL